MTAFDQAFAISKGNMANVDLAGTSGRGRRPDRIHQKWMISSVHRKDRATPAHGQGPGVGHGRYTLAKSC
jgi:hypothetical protein